MQPVVSTIAASAAMAVFAIYSARRALPKSFLKTYKRDARDTIDLMSTRLGVPVALLLGYVVVQGLVNLTATPYLLTRAQDLEDRKKAKKYIIGARQVVVRTQLFMTVAAIATAAALYNSIRDLDVEFELKK